MLHFPSMELKKLRGRILLSLLLGIIVFAGLLLYGDLRDLKDGIAGFKWYLLPAIFALSFSNYILRFFKWQVYLRLIDVRGLKWSDSLLVYLSGLGMVVTPGKVGEWLKAYLLREVHGTPLMRSAPILIAERITDTLGLLLLGGIGIFIFGDYWQIYVVIAGIAIGGILLARHRPTALYLIRLLNRLPIIKRFISHLEEFYESTYVTLVPWNVLFATALSVVSWGCEVLAFYLVLIGLGRSPTLELLLQASFILPIATLAGALLLTPGGLGVAEGGLAGLSQVIIGLEKGPAVVGTVIIRLGTLWFAVFVGLIAFAVLNRRLAVTGPVPSELPSQALQEPLQD